MGRGGDGVPVSIFVLLILFVQLSNIALICQNKISSSHHGQKRRLEPRSVQKVSVGTHVPPSYSRQLRFSKFWVIS